jgi:hypothetical protein
MKSNRVVQWIALETLAMVLAMSTVATAQTGEMKAAEGEAKPGAIIEDFEKELVKYPDEKTGCQFSTASIARSADVKNGVGAGEITFNVKPGSWALVQKKIEGSEWLGRGPKAISFWVKGGGSGNMTVELEESYTFKWRKEVPLTDKTWHQVKIRFKEFACGDKPVMSPADLVAVKFVCFDGSTKVLLDDVQIEFTE